MKEAKSGYYLYCYGDLSGSIVAMSGVEKKIVAQIKALNNKNLNCSFRYCRSPKTLLGKAFSCLPFVSEGIKWPRVSDLGNPSYLYIRRPALVGRGLIRFLKCFRRANPEAIVLYEIPSYPYDGEMVGSLSVALRKDKRYRGQLKKYVDYIVDLSGHEAIFGVPTIQITNGIDLDLYQPKKPVDDLNIVNVVSVAFFEQWHGIDRFIKGLHDYLQEGNERLVHVHLVGGGSALPSLERLVVDLGLQKYVTFYGVLQGEELSAVYDRCSLAIECLGIHRKGRGQRSASLKSREYLARGIPFFGSSEIDVFAKHPMRYFFKEPEDESNIDIEELIQFHDALYENHGQEAIIAEMREYAERYISMDSAMKNVTGFLTES